jgi:hypothetical protein
MRLLMLSAALCAAAVGGLGAEPPASARFQGNMVIQRELQKVNSLSGEVVDPSGAPMASAFVEEMDSTWKNTLRSMKTDENGKFVFSETKGQKIYYLQFTVKDFQLMRVPVRVSHRLGRPLKITMQVGV